MSYITINTEVTIDFDKISDDDLIEVIEYKLRLYTKKNSPKFYQDFKKSILECLNYDTVMEPAEGEGSVQDWLKDKVIFDLVAKYRLEELEAFLNKK
jgi:hypothetical protein